MAYTLKEWSSDLDLTAVYSKATELGYYAGNQYNLVESMNNEEAWNVWILYEDETPVATAAAHTWPEMGENAFRILTRVSVLESERIPDTSRDINAYVVQHQNIVSQYFIPAMIAWCKETKDNPSIYIGTDSNDDKIKAHELVLPMLAEQGECSKVQTITYRGNDIQVWQFNSDTFETNLAKYDRWELS